MLPVAGEVGLRRVEITCDDDNEASRRVIVKNGGELFGIRPEDVFINLVDVRRENWSVGKGEAQYAS